MGVGSGSMSRDGAATIVDDETRRRARKAEVRTIFFTRKILLVARAINARR
jgi:hypothetical protein